MEQAVQTGKARSGSEDRNPPTGKVGVKVEILSADKVMQFIGRVVDVKAPGAAKVVAKRTAKVARENTEEGRARSKAVAMRDALRDAEKAVKTEVESQGWSIQMVKVGPSLSVAPWMLYPQLIEQLAGLNRNLNEARWKGYCEDMDKGRWLFTPDPIVISDTGDILNGQHRLMAALNVTTWEPGITIPQFVVVWGVDKKAALLVDEARRTQDDRRQIALRYANAVA